MGPSGHAANPNPAYASPSKWNQFQRPSSSLSEAVSAAADVGQQQASPRLMLTATSDNGELLPSPQVHSPQVHTPAPEHVESSIGIPTDDCHGCVTGGCQSPYAHAVAAPCQSGSCGTCQTSAGPQPIAPWFGGASLLFWNYDSNNDSVLITDDSAMILRRTGDVDPDNEVGFDAHFGRYFGCGTYGLDFGYLLWNPGAQSRILANGGAGYRVTIPALTTVSINRGAGATTVYDDYDMNASRLRVTRDLRVQGFEANLVSFGLMGGRRLGSCSPSPLFDCLGSCANGFYGGATGPLARAACGQVRVRTSHGFRWFQLEDYFEIAGDVDGTGGYQPADLYYMINTENNLFGYQFGSVLTYCLGCRTMLNLGGKIGIYGNDATFSHRITTNTAMAYTNTQGAGAGDICTDDSDVSLAGLGELDFGLGYRLSNRWTITGGYRMLMACGVATAVGQMPTEYVTAQSAGAVRADDSLLLHGAYVGFNCNW